MTPATRRRARRRSKNKVPVSRCAVRLCGQYRCAGCRAPADRRAARREPAVCHAAAERGHGEAGGGAEEAGMAVPCRLLRRGRGVAAGRRARSASALDGSIATTTTPCAHVFCTACGASCAVDTSEPCGGRTSRTSRTSRCDARTRPRRRVGAAGAVLCRILLGYPSENLLRHAATVARVHPEWRRLVRSHAVYAPEVAGRATKLPTGELATATAERRRVLRGCSAGLWWLQNGSRKGELSVSNVRATPMRHPD